MEANDKEALLVRVPRGVKARLLREVVRLKVSGLDRRASMSGLVAEAVTHHLDAARKDDR